MKAFLPFFLIGIPCFSLAQCPLAGDSCSATIQAGSIVVSSTQALSGAYQCFHVLAGGDLSYDGAFSTFLVESGGTVNANGTGNVVLAKSGASVGFCGSGYANSVYHEAGTTLTCMSGNSEHTCANVIFTSTVGMMETSSIPHLRYEPVTNSLLVPETWKGSTLHVTDAIGRVTNYTVASTRVSLAGLPPGSYVAIMVGSSASTPLRFVRW